MNETWGDYLAAIRRDTPRLMRLCVDRGDPKLLATFEFGQLKGDHFRKTCPRNVAPREHWLFIVAMDHDDVCRPLEFIVGCAPRRPIFAGSRCFELVPPRQSFGIDLAGHLDSDYVVPAGAVHMYGWRIPDAEVP